MLRYRLYSVYLYAHVKYCLIIELAETVQRLMMEQLDVEQAAHGWEN